MLLTLVLETITTPRQPACSVPCNNLMYIELEKDTDYCDFLFVKHHVENWIMGVHFTLPFFWHKARSAGKLFQELVKIIVASVRSVWSSCTEVSCHQGPVPSIRISLFVDRAKMSEDKWILGFFWFLGVMVCMQSRI